MFPFFFLLFVAVTVAVVAHVKSRRNRLRDCFAQAAGQLDFALSEEGAVIPRPWIFGYKDGLRIDVRPFASRSGGQSRVWTGFRVTFAEPVTVITRGPSDPRQRGLMRLNRAFRECEVDRESLFCAMASLPDSATTLVEAVELIAAVAQSFVSASSVDAAAAVEASPDEPPVVPPPLPLPPGESPPQPTAVEPMATPATTAVPIPAAADDEEPAAPDPEPLPAIAGTPSPCPAALTPLARAGADLFASGRNHFDTARRFDDTYAGQTLAGTGILRKVERYSLDRIHGRGPGLLAEVEATTCEPDTGRTVTFHLLVPLPDIDGRAPVLADWRPAIGRPTRLSGTLLRCDSFTRRLHLADGRVTPTEPGTTA